MRISDWSSDVCSSDLLGGQRIDQQRRDRDGQTDAERPPRFTLVFENLASVLERAEQRRHALIICRALCRQRERSGRSEEHTSELQSLMRISYAVFCLKKKKNTHKTTRNKKQQKSDIHMQD